MILILVVAFFGYGVCTDAGAVSGIYGDYGDFQESLKNVGEYELKQYDQQEYIDAYNKGDGKNKGYEKDEGKKGREDDKKDEREYLEEYQKYNGEQKYKNQKDSNGYSHRYEDILYRYDDKKDDQWGYEGYYDQKFDKYDGPKDYVKSDKYRDGDKDYSYGRYDDKFDIREYDYKGKCDFKEKDCKDGKDCYDKAKDRTEYDKCRDQYGHEDRYYDEKDRLTGERYRYYNDTDHYGYEKDCYDKSKDRSDYDKCLGRYNDKQNRYDYDKDCYDNTKDRSDYNKCRRYYRRCRDYNYSRDYRYFYNEDDWKNNKDCYYDRNNLVGLGRNDREDQLIRPCALDDRQCIRKYLARNSKCKPAYGPIPDPFYMRRSTLYFPFANITAIRTRQRVTGLSSIKISEFYVNKDTGNLVIALDFMKLNQTSPKVYFRYKRTAKESIVLSDYATIEYKSGTFTAVIPKIPHLRLDLAEVHADIDDIPLFFVGPKAYDSKDPEVIAAFARLVSDLPTATQELFLFLSQLLTAIYIQENLCDFGLKLISV